MDFSKSYPKILERILFITLVAFGIALVLFAPPTSADTTSVSSVSSVSLARPALAGSITQSITHTTVADFNGGSFYLTGMTKSSNGGGDGNGEVRLMTVGISQQDWNPLPYNLAISRTFPSLWGHAAAQKDGVIFVSGGKVNYTDPDPIATIYTTTIKSDHSLAPWQASTFSLPQAVWGHGMVIVSNTLVVLGGKTTGGGRINSVYTATIHSNGTISAFQAATPMPNTLWDFGVTVISGTVYVDGGFSSNATDLIYYTTPDPRSGAITQWFTATMHVRANNTPSNIQQLTTASYNNRFYQIGGYDGASADPYPYVAIVEPSSNRNIVSPNFTDTLQLGQNLINASSAAYGGQIFAAGGQIQNGSAGVPIIFSALVTATGELFNPVTPGAWQQSNVLSSGRIRSAAVMSNDGWLYVLGGVTSDSGSQVSLASYDFGPTSGDHPSDYALSGSFTSPLIDVGNDSTVSNIALNTTITQSTGMSLTIQYYCGSTPLSLTNCSAPASGANYGVRQTTNISLSVKAQYWKYVINFVRGTVVNQSPILNWVRFDYQIPQYPDFAITNMLTPITNSITTTQVITYYVKNLESPASPSVRAPAKAPTIKRAPAIDSSDTPSYLFRIAFYHDRLSAPTGPNDLTNAMSCIDVNYLYPGTWPQHDAQGAGPFYPYIYLIEPDLTARAFYARCDVPPYSTNFYAQIDVCDTSIAPTGWCTSHTYGYALEKNELSGVPVYPNYNNIIGPLSARTSGGGGGGDGSGGLFMPFIRK
jgi:hypothetical protein